MQAGVYIPVNQSAWCILVVLNAMNTNNINVEVVDGKLWPLEYVHATRVSRSRVRDFQIWVSVLSMF